MICCLLVSIRCSEEKKKHKEKDKKCVDTFRWTNVVKGDLLAVPGDETWDSMGNLN